MKDLKAFMEKVAKDPKLASRVDSAANEEEVVALAADAGYKFTVDELMDERMSQVAGGAGWWNGIKGAVSGAARDVGKSVVQGLSQAGATAGQAAAGAAANLLQQGATAISGMAQPAPVSEEWGPSDLFGD